MRQESQPRTTATLLHASRLSPRPLPSQLPSLACCAHKKASAPPTRTGTRRCAATPFQLRSGAAELGMECLLAFVGGGKGTFRSRQRLLHLPCLRLLRVQLSDELHDSVTARVQRRSGKHTLAEHAECTGLCVACVRFRQARLPTCTAGACLPLLPARRRWHRSQRGSRGTTHRPRRHCQRQSRCRHLRHRYCP